MLLNMLRVQKRPYIVYGALLLIASIMSAGIFIQNNNTFFNVMTVLLCLIAPNIYILIAFWFYRIELFEDVLIDKGLKRTKKAPVAAITKLKLEVGYGDQKWLWGPTLRPFRRLAVYYTVDNKQQSLDISLIHFDIQDVRELLSKLIKIRPDLEMPKNFPKQRKQQA